MCRQVGFQFPDPALPPEGGRDSGEEPDEDPDPEGSDDYDQNGSVRVIVEKPDGDDPRVLDREHRHAPQKNDQNDKDEPHGKADYNRMDSIGEYRYGWVTLFSPETSSFRISLRIRSHSSFPGHSMSHGSMWVTTWALSSAWDTSISRWSATRWAS